MKLPTFRKPPTFTVILPAMVVFSLAAYFLLGALPSALLTGDFIAALAQLAVISTYAFAAVGFTWWIRKHLVRDISNAEEADMHTAIRAGDLTLESAAAGKRSVSRSAPVLRLLWLDFARWFLPLCAFLIFFYPAR